MKDAATFERLAAVMELIAGELSPTRKSELLTMGRQALRPYIADHRVSGVKELFYLSLADAIILADIIVDELRAEEGLKILEESMGGPGNGIN